MICAMGPASLDRGDEGGVEDREHAGRGVLHTRAAGPCGVRLVGHDVADADVGRFLKLFTDLSLEDVGKLESLSGADINQAKIVLATEATALLHGREAAEAAARTAAETFGAGGIGEDLPTLSLGEGMNITHALTALGFTPSNKEAKRKIAEGAVRLEDVAVKDPGLMLVADSEPLKLSLGKKRHALLVK